MGTATLFQTGTQVSANAGAFASELLGIFNALIGDWGYPVIATAALAVMWSTQVALMDILPRVWDRLTDVVTGRPQGWPSRYTKFLLIQVVGVSFILLFLIQHFNTFLMLTTSLGFITAPAIAYYNYRAVTSKDIAEEYRPNSRLIIWNWIAVIAMAAFALAFLYLSTF